MRKLYAFLIVMVAMGAISTEIARAQYTINDYVVRKVDAPDPQGLGSGANWHAITGTVDQSGELAYYQGYYPYGGTPHPLPFNVTFADKQLTTSNNFEITCCGSVNLSPTWPSTAYYYPYDGYNFMEWEPTSSGGSYYNYEYGESTGNNEYDGGSYGEFSNYTLAPFAGYMINYIPEESGPKSAFQYAVLGSAPNRELVVEADNQYSFENYAFGWTNYVSWQTVIYESGISHFQFNYSPTTGSNPFQYSTTYENCPITFGSRTYPGSWAYTEYSYNYGSYALIEALTCWVGMKTTGGQFIDIDFNGNGWDESRDFYVAHNTMYGSDGSPMMPDTCRYLPQSSVSMQIAWNYDFSADAITNPPSEALEAKGTAFTPTVQITNQGRLIPTSLQVNLVMSIVNGPEVYNQTITVPPSGSLPGAFSTGTVSFPPYTPHDTTIDGILYYGYNIYEDTAIVFNLQPTADQDPSNNTTTNEWICSPPNDIKAVAILSPPVGTGASDRTPIAIATPIDMRFRNTGTSTQTNVPLTAVIRDPSGAVEYRDTLWIPNWPTGATGGNSDGSSDFSQAGQGPGKGPYYDTTFPEQWTPTVVGIHKICGISILPGDQLPGDDTVCGQVLVRPIYDAAATSIVNPQPDEEKPEKTTWQPGALFASLGVSDLFDVPTEVRIYSCSNPTTPVFISDSTIPELNIDQGNVRFYFPAVNGTYRISNLPPGCYTICAIAKYPGDGDHTNDTACSEFSIIPQLKGNIYVGVGQRFQTIHAAADSIAFRGVSDTLHLILTDANYTENGTDIASSPNAAIDFRHLQLSPTTPVIWEPKPGVHPTITFTGRQPSCFYFGDLFGGYMTFEGYNPLGVPVPDKLMAEPAKRGLTIVDNETNAGSIFDIEQGSSHLTMKDLILHGNGNFTSDSSSAIRIYNQQNRSIYLQLVHDTIPINHIVVNNCELGNAKYGLYDHGLHDMFNLGSEQYIVWRNNSNTFTRNTIGTSSDPLSFAGISFTNEQDLTVSHNEITNVNSANAGSTGMNWNVYGIESPQNDGSSDAGYGHAWRSSGHGGQRGSLLGGCQPYSRHSFGGWRCLWRSDPAGGDDLPGRQWGPWGSIDVTDRNAEPHHEQHDLRSSGRRWRRRRRDVWLVPDRDDDGGLAVFCGPGFDLQQLDLDEQRVSQYQGAVREARVLVEQHFAEHRLGSVFELLAGGSATVCERDQLGL